MRLIGIVSTAVLSLSLGALPGYAQQEQHEQQEEQKDKPAEQKEKKAEPERKPEQNEKGAQQEKNAKPEQRNAQQEKNVKPEEKNAQQQQHAQKSGPAAQTHQSNAKGGTRIPDDRYRANFGKEHTFRVTQSDYSRNRRFQYGGYWFGFVDPWPSNWLYTQNVFVIDIDGVYYLCNPMYPGVNIALNITM